MMPTPGPWHFVAGGAIALVVAAAVFFAFTGDWMVADLRRALRRPATWMAGLPVFLAVLLVGVPFLYQRSTELETVAPLSLADLPMETTTTVAEPVPDPAEVSVPVSEPPVAGETTTTAVPVTAPDTAPSTTAPAAGPVDGAWKVGQGSQARYAIDDTMLGQTKRVVGSTDQVSGSMQITDSVLRSVNVVVQMRSVRCNCSHDGKYQDMLNTKQYPTSTFELTTPIPLDSIPADGEVVTIAVQGKLTIRGQTRAVKFNLDAVRRGGRIAVSGIIPVNPSDYGIESPQAGPLAGLSNAAIELLVAFDPAP